MASIDTKTVMEQLQTRVVRMRPDDVGFGPAVSEYVRLQAQYQQEVKAENAGALSQVKMQLASSIAAMVESLNLPALIGEAVTRITYEVKPGDGENGPVTIIGVNPTRVTRVKASNGGAAREPREGQRDLTAIYDAGATVKDKEREAEVRAKYGEGGTEPDPKKLNSRLWALKNSVANRNA